MKTIKAIIRIEKNAIGNNPTPVVIFPTVQGVRRNANSCEIYARLGQHQPVSDAKGFIEKLCRNPETNEEKADCFDLMMEVTAQYKIGEPVEILWQTGKFTASDYEAWKQARIDSV